MDPEFGNFDQLKHKARSKSLDASNFFPTEFLFCVEATGSFSCRCQLPAEFFFCVEKFIFAMYCV